MQNYMHKNLKYKPKMLYKSTLATSARLWSYGLSRYTNGLLLQLGTATQQFWRSSLFAQTIIEGSDVVYIGLLEGEKNLLSIKMVLWLRLETAKDGVAVVQLWSDKR